MLELHHLSLSARRAADETWLLKEISLRLPSRHLCAVIGSSGCGKSTLLKTIAGIHAPEEGALLWNGRDLEQQDLEPHEIGYVPQFSIAYELLTVRESLETALRLRLGGLSAVERLHRLERILQAVGLEVIAKRRVRVLSGGQRRRLSLALEMVSEPVLLLCDEVTSGLDPQSESEIVALLRRLAGHANEAPGETRRTVLSVTHSLRHLQQHDSVAVMYEGHLIFHGPPALLAHYFSLQSTEDLFHSFGERAVEDWHRSWQKHRASYEASLFHDEQEVSREKDAPITKVLSTPELEPDEAAMVSTSEFQRPHRVSQFLTLTGRRWRLFARDRGQLALQLALLFGFPCLVVIFAWDGLPQIQNLTGSGNAVQQLLESAAFALQSSRTASLVSGLVMFQVILLTLVGSNNSAREIAGERAIFEKEKFAGVHASSYVASKALYLLVLVSVQSLWMAFFVSTVCRFPGSLATQAGVLFLVNASMTSVCLGISSLMKAAEQASLVSVYLVGFQLPLSGAVLALPHVIGWLTQPFIAAYWGWAGYLQTMRETRFYDVVQSISQTEMAELSLSQWALTFHVLGGLVLAYLGCKHSRWE